MGTGPVFLYASFVLGSESLVRDVRSIRTTPSICEEMESLVAVHFDHRLSRSWRCSTPKDCESFFLFCVILFDPFIILGCILYNSIVSFSFGVLVLS